MGVSVARPVKCRLTVVHRTADDTEKDLPLLFAVDMVGSLDLVCHKTPFRSLKSIQLPAETYQGHVPRT